jgi:hypothetical protein
MLNAFIPLGIMIVIGIIAVVIKSRMVAEGKESKNYPYEKAPVLFTPAERSFLGVLEQAVNGHHRIMGKVRLADVVNVKPEMSRSEWQKAFNRIQSKHLDFVVCDSSTLAIKFVIELDDKSHDQRMRQDRDAFLDNALKAAGIRVFHFTAKRTYSVQEIQNVLRPATEMPVASSK